MESELTAYDTVFWNALGQMYMIPRPSRKTLNSYITTINDVFSST
jgi:hypothetical protein